MNKNIYKNVVVPESVLLKVERPDKYGSVPGLDDEELASPDELERQIVRAELGPILLLPVKSKKSGYCPAWDYSEDVGFDAFGTVDFERGRQEFDRARFKADKLEEQFKDLAIRFSILSEHITGYTKYKVLKLVGKGIIEVDDISNWDMWQLAKMYMRSLWLRKQIKELREASRMRKERKVQAWLDS